MKLGVWSARGIAVACGLVILANAPAVLTDPLFLAVAQIRSNAATSIQVNEAGEPVLMGPSTTSAKKSK